MVLSEVCVGALRAVEVVCCFVGAGGGCVGGWVVNLCGFAEFACVEAVDGV